MSEINKNELTPTVPQPKKENLITRCWNNFVQAPIPNKALAITGLTAIILTAVNLITGSNLGSSNIDVPVDTPNIVE